jgi:hypothetical protein
MYQTCRTNPFHGTVLSNCKPARVSNEDLYPQRASLTLPDAIGIEQLCNESGTSLVVNISGWVLKEQENWSRLTLVPVSSWSALKHEQGPYKCSTKISLPRWNCILFVVSFDQDEGAYDVRNNGHGLRWTSKVADECEPH